MARKARNYIKENAWEDTKAQVKRREARNAARRKATKRLGKTALKGKEVDHLGSNRKGDLSKRRTRVVTKHANRIRQPKRSH